MSFSNPIFLWALTGLAIPIGIHLLSRKEGRVIKIGSIRFLNETPTRQFKSIRLNEVLLLALRSLLIILITFYLAGFQLNFLNKNINNWVLLENSIKPSDKLKSFLDSLTSNGYELHYLAEGFPTEEQANTFIDYRKLANSLGELSNTNVIVISNNYLKNYIGKLEAIPKNIEWISLPPEEITVEYPISRDGANNIVRKGVYSESLSNYETSLNSNLNNSDSLLFRQSIKIGIKSDSDFLLEEKIIKAILEAFDENYPGLFYIQELPDFNKINELDWVINLTAENIDLPSKNLINIKVTSGNSILEKISPTEWVITKRLDDEIALDTNFPIRLCKVLYSNSSTKPIEIVDQRTVIAETAWSSGNPDKSSFSKIATSQTADLPLLLLIIGVLILERIISFIRKQ